ncbi:MAG: hypothetical protein ACI841_004020 [Planctomycetota bacterium]|jgi:hypothetical protein
MRSKPQASSASKKVCEPRSVISRRSPLSRSSHAKRAEVGEVCPCERASPRARRFVDSMGLDCMSLLPRPSEWARPSLMGKLSIPQMGMLCPISRLAPVRRERALMFDSILRDQRNAWKPCESPARDPAPMRAACQKKRPSVGATAHSLVSPGATPPASVHSEVNTHQAHASRVKFWKSRTPAGSESSRAPTSDRGVSCRMRDPHPAIPCDSC